MKRDYHCPSCEATLNPGTKIVLRATHGHRKGLILLSPQPGNYDAIIPAELALTAGHSVDLFCPVCGTDLRCPSDERLAGITFQSAREAGKVFFSRLVGEHATWVVTRETVRPYGEDADRYGNGNFFGESVDKG
jgi:RNase P subunit RPR2